MLWSFEIRNGIFASLSNRFDLPVLQDLLIIFAPSKKMLFTNLFSLLLIAMMKDQVAKGTSDGLSSFLLSLIQYLRSKCQIVSQMSNKSMLSVSKTKLIDYIRSP